MRLPGGCAPALAFAVVVGLALGEAFGAPLAIAADPPAAWTGAAADAVTTETGGISLSVGPGRLVVEGPVGAGSAVGQLTVHVAAPFRVRVTATLADAAAGADGAPGRAPLGSTHWTLGNVVTLTGNAFDYLPGFDQATFTVTVTARAPAFEQPRLGLVVVTAVPDAGAAGAAGSAGSGLASVSAIVVTGPNAASAPAVADAAPMLAVDGLDVSRQPWTGLDRSFGDPLRWLLDHGPATLTWQYSNNGDSAGEAATTYRVVELGPFGWLPFVHDDGSLVRTGGLVPRVILPGQAVTETLSTDFAAAPLQPAWSLPSFGAVRITIRTSSVVAGLEAPAAEQSVVLVVVPWKEILALLIGLLGLAAALSLVRAGARRVRDRGRPLHHTEVHIYSPVDAIRERTTPVLSFGTPAAPPAPAPGTPAAATPAAEPGAVTAAAPSEPETAPVPAPLETPAAEPETAPVPAPLETPAWTTRRPLHGPPPKSGTPTV